MVRRSYERIEDGDEFSPSRESSSWKIKVAVFSTVAITSGVIALNEATGTKMVSLRASESGKEAVYDWQQRADVQEMAAKKVVYGGMSEQDVKGLFTQFKQDFGRSYLEDEEETRFELFKENLKTIDFYNRYNPLALFGITDAADMTQEELTQRKMKSDWSNYEQMKAGLPKGLVEAAAKGPSYVAGKTFDADGEVADTEEGSADMKKGQVNWASEKDCAACATFPDFKEYNTSSKPDNFDWRDLGAVSSVKNQKYCGSCWTFSTAQDIEGTHFLATGNLTSFAEQQLVACDIKNDGCDGGWMYAAMQYVIDFGAIVTDNAYPYKGVLMTYDLPTPTCDTELLNNKLSKDGDDIGHIEAFQMVAMGSEYEDLMATVLLKNGPLSLAINAAGMDYYVHGIVGCETIAGSDYCEAGTIDQHTPCDPTELDHGVLAVAYGIQDGVKYWVIKNSWGEDWGEGGYYRIERETNKCGVANMVQHSVYKKVNA